MQNANKKKITGAVALAAAGVMALGGVSMLFTDRADVSGETTAGKLAIGITADKMTANGDFSEQLWNTAFEEKKNVQKWRSLSKIMVVLTACFWVWE